MNEDFVPFELSVKLKYKGFRGLCLAYYTNDDTLYYNYSHKAGASYTDCYLSHNLMPKDSVSGKFVDAPTISQVLKWLREEKKIYIMIDRSFSVKNSWHYVICNNDDFEHLIQQESIPNRKWEQAAIAGIEYIIDNNIACTGKCEKYEKED